MTEGVHSTGRGGAGNIGAEAKDTVYVDGSIIREGDASSAIGSSGRGGAGNIAADTRHRNPATNEATGADRSTATDRPAPGTRSKSQIVVPQTATLPEVDDFHCGRGGEGNVHRKKYGGHSQQMTPKEESGGQFPIVTKLKQMVGLESKPVGTSEKSTVPPAATGSVSTQVTSTDEVPAEKST